MAFGRRKSRIPDEATTLFFASDLHGSEVCWRKFVAAARFYPADLLVLGGDFTGKLVVPVVESGRSYRATFLGGPHTIERDGLDAFQRQVADLGSYPQVMSEEEYAHLQEHPQAVAALFDRLIRDRVVEWINHARKVLDGSEIRILTAPANDDPYSIDQVIADHGDGRFCNVEGRVVEVAPGHEMISSGWTNPTPWNTPREFPEHEITAHVEEMVAELANPAASIFNLHPPPYNSKIDTAPQLDGDLNVVTSAGAQVMVPVGSTAVRQLIETHQPLLSLHGHIHESAGAVKIGRTTAINPGSEYGEGMLRGVLVTVGGGKILSHQATTG